MFGHLATTWSGVLSNTKSEHMWMCESLFSVSKWDFWVPYGEEIAGGMKAE